MGLAGHLLLSENSSLRTDSAAVPCVYVFFTHAHDDHICDAFTLARLHCATLVEREQSYGWIELMLTARAADRTVTFRNLGWSADTPAAVPATAVESATPTPILFKIVRNPRHQPFAPNRDLNRQAMSAPFRA